MSTLWPDQKAPKPLYYVATPYTHYHAGHEQAFIEACKAAAILMKRGMNVFSPIAHAHGIAVHGNIDNVDRDFWLPQCLAVLDECDALLVIMMPGWRESVGIAEEIKHAKKHGRPVSYLSWPMLEERAP